MKEPIEVETVADLNEALDYIQNKRVPFVIRNFNIGECTTKWSADYLKEKINKEVKIHVAPSTGDMNFLKKNFIYRTLPFDEFIKRASQDTQTDYFIDPNEKYYLRSIGNDERKDISDIKKQFPQINDDIIFPQLFDQSKYFSSVFRITSKQVRIWTHYDIMDNMLIQVVGDKKVIFFPPDDIDYMYMKGDKSEVIDVENPNLDKYPLFKNVQKYVTILHPSDLVFIPALWLHNTIAQTFSVGVNLFWKHLDDSFYDKQDLYGNKDLVQATKAFDLLKRSIKEVNSLPKDYKEFYLRRMIQMLKENI